MFSVVLSVDRAIGRIELPAVDLTIVSPDTDGFILNLVTSPDQSKVAYELLGGNMFVMNMPIQRNFIHLTVI